MSTQVKGEKMYNEVILNLETGKEITRPYTEAEIAEVIQAQEKIAVKLEKAAQAEASKAVATAKLAALGLTTDDLKALGL
jgi:hypothetical protein